MPDKLRSLTLISTANRSRQPARSIWERIEGEKEGEEESSHFQSLFAPVLKDQKKSFKRPVNSGFFSSILRNIADGDVTAFKFYGCRSQNLFTFSKLQAVIDTGVFGCFLSEIIRVCLIIRPL